MSISLYDASVPVLVRVLKNLSGILDKGVAHAAATGMAEADLVNARLAPDMYPLSGQVQRVSDSAKGCAARLTGTEIPGFPDDEVTIRDLQERIAKTVAYLETFSPASFDGAGERPVTINIRKQPHTMSGSAYLLNFALPNVFFHATTAYGILRHKGVEVGKMDFLGEF
ncbi:hypothetical protein FHS85_002281 [Rhodoligotrophos appendicifer]|uniref:DUF1993 domain-containing protein n=1 Tax=Rhodoligotrophos appendicifer TaxID=987056 RepID=UPI0011850A00|nr:DUF1993 domain-containing protein [Rhodoligotrophos appendicifer]